MVGVDLKAHISRMLAEGIRFDGRKLLDWRPVTIMTAISKNAEGSARVRFGETDVMTGIKLSIGTPYPDRPDEGALMVEAELTPMSSPEFEAGPPDVQAIELARVVDRGIREAKAIDMKKLCIVPGEKCWVVNIDVVTINDAGNLMDAAALAAITALKTTRFPKTENGIIKYGELTDQPLPITKEPIAVTVIKIGDKLIVDPSVDEEKIIDTKLTVTSMPEGMLCALQKGGDGTLSLEEIAQMVEIGIAKAHELREVLNRALKEHADD